jgi:iron complex outermembrane receptor protein
MCISTAFAQTAPEDITEIVVTAQKREQGIQDVAISVTALGSEALQAMGRQDVTALAGQVPSLQVNQYSPTVTVFNIRGVSQNDFADSQEAPIAFYNDEVYIGALGAISGQTFDLDRIEILRGPQGTLFGRNATGGLVQIVTAKPTRQFEGFATVTVGSHGQIATEGAISGPLTDGIRARLSATSNHHGGYIDNDSGPDRGGARFYGGRFQIEADVGSSGKLLVKLEGLRNDRERSAGAYSHVSTGVTSDGLGFALASSEDFWGTCAGCDATGYKDADGDPFTGSYNYDARFDRKYWGANVRYEQDFGDVNFVSLTNYQDLKKIYSEDADISPNSIFVYTTDQNLYQMSQEFRISGDSDKFNWVAGVYGLKIRTDNIYNANLMDSFGINEVYGGRQTTESLAVFGQGEYFLMDQVSLVLGARYSWDWKKFDFTHTEFYADGSAPSVFQFNPTTDPELAKQKFDNYSYNIQVNLHPTDDTLFYFGVNRGTKSGGFGVQAFQPINPNTIPFDEEILTNYEAGFKVTLFDRKVNLNGSVFYYDYQNYQAFSIVGLSQFVGNKPAEVVGAELELQVRPARGLFLSGFLTKLDTQVKDIVLPSGRMVDRIMPQAPSLSLGGMVRYEFPVGPGALSMQTDWKYDSSQYFSTFNAPIDREPSRVVGNVRVTYATDDDHWEVAAFANNVTDTEYRIYNLDLSSTFGFSQQTFARPRWFGGSVKYSF